MYWSLCVNERLCLFLLPTLWYSPVSSPIQMIFSPRPTSCFLHLPVNDSSHRSPSYFSPPPPPITSSPPPVIPVTSTGRPNTRTRFWRLRGVDSWNSSSLSPKASSHLKVSATSKVRSPAPGKGAIFFPSIHVCERVVRLCESALISVVA